MNALVLPPVLDVCCGGRMMWFDKADDRALFVDRRCESFRVKDGRPGLFDVSPDMVCDFTALPFPDNAFAHVVFDPPHIIRREALGDVSRKYGVLNGSWREMIRKGFVECFRVLRPDGVLVFKWCEVQVPLREILTLTPERPLYGHKAGKSMNTHWMAFIKQNNVLTVSGGRKGSNA